MSTSTEPAPAPRTRPGWLVELLEVIELRRRALLLAVGGLALAGLLAAVVVPAFLPPRPEVGAAVGLAAVLLGVAITFGLDSLDLKVRGPRHVRSSGGLLAQQLTGAPSPAVLTRLVAPLAARARAEGRVLLGLSPLDDDLDAEGWQDALSSALADDGLRVLTVDLQRPAETHPGVVEVVEGGSSLADAVTFDGERMVARLGPGRDPAAALGGLRAVIERLPSDIDVLVVLLPPPSGGGVLGAAAVLDHVYVMAEVDRTARVDLIAALDAFDAVQATSEVLLVAPGSATPAPAAPPDAAADVPAVQPPDAEDAPAVAEAAAFGVPPIQGDTGGEAPATIAEPEATEEPATIAEPRAMDEPLAMDEPPAADEPPAVAEAVEEAAGTEPPAVVEEPRADDPQLRLMMAEAALELTGLADHGSPGSGPAPPTPDDRAADEQAPDDVPIAEDDDPTVETPPVVLDDPAPPVDAPVAPEAADAGVAPAEPPAWPDDPEPADEGLAHDLPEDPERVAAVLQGLGPELWSPAQPRMTTGPRG